MIEFIIHDYITILFQYTDIMNKRSSEQGSIRDSIIGHRNEQHD